MVILGFLRCLPEKQVGANGGAHHRNDDGGVVTQAHVGLQKCPRLKRFGRDLPPGNFDRQNHRHVSEQGECQPFQNAYRALIREEDRRDNAHDAKYENGNAGRDGRK